MTIVITTPVPNVVRKLPESLEFFEFLKWRVSKVGTAE